MFVAGLSGLWTHVGLAGFSQFRQLGGGTSSKQGMVAAAQIGWEQLMGDLICQWAGLHDRRRLTA